MEESLTFKSQGACAGRTRVEKILLALLFVFVLAIIALVIAVAVVAKDADKETAAQEICNTKDCVQTAARVLDNIDFSVEPCDDFYKYACGGWSKRHIIPEDASRQNVFSLVAEDVQVTNKYLLEDEENYRDVESIQKAKDMYASCLDLDKIEDLNKTVAIPLLEEFGGWPVLGSNPGGNWDAAKFDLVKLLATLRQYNNKPIISMYVYSDTKNSTNHVIYLDQPGFGLPGRDYYLEPSLERMREAYVTYASSVMVLFGANPVTAEHDMRDVLSFETDLANISMKSEDRRDNEALYNKMTIDEMAINFTEPVDTEPIQFKWLNYIQSIMSIDGVNIAITGSEPVVVRAVPYLNQVFSVMQKYQPRTVANYLVWYIMRNRVGNLPRTFNDLAKDYNKAVFGTQSDSARWKTCVSFVVGNFGLAVGHMFVKTAFDESSKASALDMIHNLKDAFSELLDELDWMDDTTKALARDKAAAMREWIGYPDYVMQEEEINTIYENVTVSRDKFFENVLNNLKFVVTNELKDLRETYNKSIWTTAPSTVNAMYSPVRNNIMFPAGILQPPFYSKDQPKSMNYGGIGMVIGHEITHGFDDRGRQFDKEGNIKEWWAETVITNFKEKAQCIVDQYDGFLMPEANLTLNGINTQGENIADNGGLKQSYRAYRKWVASQGKEEPQLPGVDFNHDQLFFINFAQIWCNNARPEYTINAVKNGVHSPGQFRVIGTLQNSPEFSRVFGCPASSYMNRQKKCYVW